jgi:hypothetical protein
MKLKGLAPEKPPKLSAEVKKELDQCVRLLTSSDDNLRSAFVAHVLRWTIPATRNLIIDRLVKALNSGGEEARAQAAASLADMGPAAVSAVKLRLLRTRTPRLQARLAELLARIGRQLPPSDQLDLMVALELAAVRARDATAREAVLKALAGLCSGGAGSATMADRTGKAR